MKSKLYKIESGSRVKMQAISNFASESFNGCEGIFVEETPGNNVVRITNFPEKYKNFGVTYLGTQLNFRKEYWDMTLVGGGEWDFEENLT